MNEDSTPEIRVMPLSALTPAAYNPRTISQEAARGLRASLRRFGLVQPIVWNERTGNVVGGHQRIEALKSLGKTEAQVVVVDLPVSKEKALNVTLNNPSISGEFTADLQGILAELSELPDLEFEELRLNALLDVSLDGIVEDEVPEPPKNPVTRPGDLWTLGDHRLLCGDASRNEDRQRVVGNGLPALLATDPPYGINYAKVVEGRGRQKVGRKAWGALANDDLSDENYLALLTAAFSVAAPVALVWYAHSRRATVQAALEAAGFKVGQEIVWVKSSLVLSRADYQWRHEQAMYAKRPGAPRLEDRTQTTVWEAGKPFQPAHPTSKPVVLYAIPIRNHTKAGDVLFDPFVGSGSAGVAAEQLERRCACIEIEPAYCDVVIERWEQLTGGKGTRR